MMTSLERAMQDLIDFYGTYLAVNCPKLRKTVSVNGYCRDCEHCNEVGKTFVDCQVTQADRVVLRIFEEINETF